MENDFRRQNEKQEQSRYTEYADGIEVDWDVVKHNTEQFINQRTRETKQAITKLHRGDKQESEMQNLSSKLKETMTVVQYNNIKVHNDFVHILRDTLNDVETKKFKMK